MINSIPYFVLGFFATALLVGLIIIIRNARKISKLFKLMKNDLESDSGILTSTFNRDFEKTTIGSLSKKISARARISRLTISRSAHKWQNEMA